MGKKVSWKLKRALFLAVLLVGTCLLTSCGEGELKDAGAASQQPETGTESLAESLEKAERGTERAEGEQPSLGESVTAESDSGETAAEEGPPYFEEEGDTLYAYGTLSETEQLWYQDVNRILGNMLTEQALGQEGLEQGLTEENLDKIFQCVLNDHPEYFYVEGYTYTKFTRLNGLVKLTFSGVYSCSRTQAEVRMRQIRLAAEQILGGAPEGMDDYEKVKFVYETLVANTEYDLEASDNQNIYSVFVNRASVCQGYAKATQYLLNRMGIPCTMVLGTVETGEGHAWNLVQVDEEYYYVDTTWGDASYRTEGELSEYMPEINYDYLCVNTEQLLRTHVPDDLIPLPDCESLEANYYVREGTYFTSWDEEKLQQAFEGAKERGMKDVTLKCSDDAVYEEMEGKLIEDQGIFQYLENAEGKIAYVRNEKQLSLTFWVTNR